MDILKNRLSDLKYLRRAASIDATVEYGKKLRDLEKAYPRHKFQIEQGPGLYLNITPSFLGDDYINYMDIPNAKYTPRCVRAIHEKFLAQCTDLLTDIADFTEEFNICLGTFDVDKFTY